MTKPTIKECLEYLNAQPPSDERDATIEVIKAIMLHWDRNNRGRFYFIALSEAKYKQYIDYLEQLSIKAKIC